MPLVTKKIYLCAYQVRIRTLELIQMSGAAPLVKVERFFCKTPS